MTVYEILKMMSYERKNYERCANKFDKKGMLYWDFIYSSNAIYLMQRKILEECKK